MQRLFCATLIGYEGSTITNQTTHIIANDEKEAFEKANKIFGEIHKDSKVKNYISCIDLTYIDGYKISVEKEA